MSIAEKLQTIAENEQRVYDAGYAKGQAEGGDTTAAYDEGFEAGKKAEYDAFWDAYQQKGNRSNYSYAFSGSGWTTNNFKPKYDVIIKNTARRMFSSAAGLVNTNIAQLFEELGIALDTSGITAADGFNEFCEYSGPATFPTIDTTGCPILSNCFFYASFLTTIQKLILKGDGSQTFSNVFIGCKNLTNLTI